LKRYTLTPAARADLEAIWDYTTLNWGQDQAERYATEIRTALDGLLAGRLRARSIAEIRPGYSKYAVGSHVLFIRANQAGNIEVVRILHGRMDAKARLDQPEQE
jgi:toxin ParE1/3/4